MEKNCYQNRIFSRKKWSIPNVRIFQKFIDKFENNEIGFDELQIDVGASTVHIPYPEISIFLGIIKLKKMKKSSAFVLNEKMMILFLGFVHKTYMDCTA